MVDLDLDLEKVLGWRGRAAVVTPVATGLVRTVLIDLYLAGLMPIAGRPDTTGFAPVLRGTVLDRIPRARVSDWATRCLGLSVARLRSFQRTAGRPSTPVTSSVLQSWSPRSNSLRNCL